MPTRKTAVSIDEELFSRADSLAHDMGISRSGLYAKALESFMGQKENLQLLAEIDEAYSSPETPAERRRRAQTTSYRKRLTEDDW